MQPFIGAYKDAVANNFINANGRLGRAGFWRFAAIDYLVLVVLAVLTNIGSFFWLIFFAYLVGLVIPRVAAGIRRLHDTGKSGWWMLFYFIPIVLLVLLALPGDPNPNSYGPPPTA